MAQPANKQVVVAVQGLSKTFKDFWLRTRAKAVDNVSFHIEQGEVFGLLGPNGSGKSTTIKVILGLLRPTSGRVAVFGKPPTDVGVKKRIGYLPEESYLYPFLNARETLDYYGKLFQIDHRTRQKRIDELLEMVGLRAVQFRAVREYSKGMQRRIGIAQALINDPDLLILDEPTTGLDPIGNRQIKDLVIELGRRGKSILLSSHLLADVEDCVTRTSILYGGRVQAEGTCDELLTSKGSSLIETETLDDATVGQIDALIRKGSSGRNSILKVSKPRQSLEALFIDIVNKAIAAKVQTSGAQHGGATASFLRADEGKELISRLVQSGADEVAAASTPVARPTVAATGPDASVISSLTGDKPAAAGTHARPAPIPKDTARRSPAPAQDVDLGVIGSLLDEGETGKRPGDKA